MENACLTQRKAKLSVSHLATQLFVKMTLAKQKKTASSMGAKRSSLTFNGEYKFSFNSNFNHFSLYFFQKHLKLNEMSL